MSSLIPTTVLFGSGKLSTICIWLSTDCYWPANETARAVGGSDPAFEVWRDRLRSSVCWRSRQSASFYKRSCIMTSNQPGVSPLRQRMTDDMRMRQLSPKTQAGYLRIVREFARYLKRSPDKAMTLDSSEFMRRFLLHVLPAGFHRIRHYGLLANPVRRTNVARIRALLGVAPRLCPLLHDAITADRPTFFCRHCGAPMLVIDILTRTVPIRAPPKAAQR
ncbi:transposase [Paraburkholderia bengalensis]|uniref:transposase n=1 Tax=Paraburkholderia bengalensis TaxID=2747562 RepID=UPI003014474C